MEQALQPTQQIGGPHDLEAEQLSLSRSLQLEHSDPCTATIYLRSSGHRLRIPAKLYQILLSFETARTITSAASGNRNVVAALEKLFARGFLVTVAEQAAADVGRLVTDPPIRLFDCPVQKLEPSAADIAILGVPYDFGDAAAAGARAGPAALRETSLQMLYGLDKRSGQPLGWFDADVDGAILRGITIGDCGDMFVDHGEPQALMFARVTAVLRCIAPTRCIPVLLGGDATVSFPLIAFMQSARPLSVVRIGASDMSDCALDSAFVSSRTLREKTLALPNIEGFVQIGSGEHNGPGRGLSGAISAARFRRKGLAALDPFIAEGSAIHLGLDMNAVIGPGAACADANMDFQFTYAELRRILQEIGERNRIVSLDLVGLNPLERCRNVMSMTAVHLLMAGLAAAAGQLPKETMQ